MFSGGMNLTTSYIEVVRINRPLSMHRLATRDARPLGADKSKAGSPDGYAEDANSTATISPLPRTSTMVDLTAGSLRRLFNDANSSCDLKDRRQQNARTQRKTCTVRQHYPTPSLLQRPRPRPQQLHRRLGYRRMYPPTKWDKSRSRLARGNVTIEPGFNWSVRSFRLTIALNGKPFARPFFQVVSNIKLQLPREPYLGHRHDVGTNATVFNIKKFTRPPKATLDFIDYEQDTVLVTNPPNTLQKGGRGRNIASFAQYWLDHNSGSIFRCRLLFQDQFQLV